MRWRTSRDGVLKMGMFPIAASPKSDFYIRMSHMIAEKIPAIASRDRSDISEITGRLSHENIEVV